MKIQNINSVNFGKYDVGKEDFRYLSENAKLLVIYDMLTEQKEALQNLADEQYNRQNELNENLKKLSLNQVKMQNFNKHAFDCIVAASSRNNNRADIAYTNIGYQYDKNNINLIG